MIEAIIQILLVILGIVAISHRESEGCFWDSTETRAVKGYFSLLIVLFHIPMTSVMYNILGNVSFVFIVFMFSFFSTYGVSVSIQKNKGYCHRIPKRILYIATAYGISILVKYLLTYDAFSGGTSWINTLLISYVVVYISFYLFGEYSTYVVVIFWLFYSIVIHCYGIPYFGWAEQSLGYAAGAIFSKYQETLWNRTRNISKISKLVIIGVSFVIILFSGYRYLKIHNIWKVTNEMYILRILLNCFELVLLWFFSTKYRLNNPVLDFCGKISLWIFLWHGLFITLLKDYFSDGILFILVLCVTVVVSTISYEIERNVLKNLVHKKQGKTLL